MKKYLSAFVGLIFLFSSERILGEIRDTSAGQKIGCPFVKFQTVYICNGSYAYAYHSASNCSGLGNCKGEIQYTDEWTAKNSFGRKPCCKCWSNVASNCHDDNPSPYGGGSSNNSDGYAYCAIALVAASAVLLSNDFYFYPTYSFFKFSNFDSTGFNANSGIVFGFRKTFKKIHSALEYGTSSINGTESKMYRNKIQKTEIRKWGAHIDYAQQIFYSKTPDWCKFYVGPTLNYVFEMGYGAIVGAELIFHDRIRFNVRYEYTTQTNQIQAGLIVTYQEKYFWKKYFKETSSCYNF